MAEELISITTAQPVDVVFKQIEDSLSQIGQVSITKKGVININPKSKYNGFASSATMEGSIRSKKDSNQYDVIITFAVKPTVACWIIGIIGGLSFFFPALMFIIPYGTARSAIRNDLQRALRQAEEELE